MKNLINKQLGHSHSSMKNVKIGQIRHSYPSGPLNTFGKESIVFETEGLEVTFTSLTEALADLANLGWELIGQSSTRDPGTSYSTYTLKWERNPNTVKLAQDWLTNNRPINQDEAFQLTIRTYAPQVRKANLELDVSEIKRLLAADEFPDAVIYVKHPEAGLRPVLLGATDRRLLFVGVTRLFIGVHREYMYDKIEGIENNSSQGTIDIQYEGKRITLTRHGDAESASQFVDFVRTKI